MKTCPSCHTQYTDDTLRFCLQDGTPLEITSVTEQPTVSLAGQEVETAARSNIRARDSEVTQWKPKSDVTHASSIKPPLSWGAKTALAVAATAVAMLLLFGVAGIGAWLYFSGGGDDIAKNTNTGNGNQNIFPPGNMNSNAPITPTRTIAPSPTRTANLNSNSPTASPTSTPNINKQQASREVSREIYDWKSLAESGDLDAYMSKYSPNVDYYRKRGASTGFVRGDKQRAFRMYSSMAITISNMDVTVDDSGDRAAAAFDKEWVFDGTHRSTGKVRQQLQFRKVNGQWLITGERDVKVYYTN